MYLSQKSNKSNESKFNLNFNNHKDTIFIIDEASMISNQDFSESIFGSSKLLKIYLVLSIMIIIADLFLLEILLNYHLLEQI